jgi:hypothetical protein
MKQELLERARRIPDLTERTNVARQYLQREILASLSGCAAFRSLAFVGGTCLRFLYDLKRYSEDMDFSVEEPAGYDPRRWMEAVRLALTQQGFAPGVSWRERRAVDFGWVRIPDVLHELGVAGTAAQCLSVKLEVDRNPPQGAVLQTTALAVPRLIAVRHHDMPSLMAGKLNAVLSRRYAKGRDWYDLLWYLARRIEPNVVLLGHGLIQSPSEHCRDARAWRRGVLNRLAALDWRAVVRDVRPFLEEPSELSAFTPETVRSMVERGGA